MQSFTVNQCKLNKTFRHVFSLNGLTNLQATDLIKKITASRLFPQGQLFRVVLLNLTDKALL
ncbi:hypothetical protein A8135_04670 [Legionella jamestowniensis]|uniref:Uncharacterized protein n=1 Tax=Legionella jamestowniensis TaxID=455 RepID=A0ABX2XQR0_9GAMM|nr:hypothetical protein A8135_04670 [Legionella jamestowniensis]